MRRILVMALLVTLTVGMTAFANQAFSPSLPESGSTEWTAELRIQIHHYDPNTWFQGILLAPDDDIDALTAELEESIRAINNHPFHYEYRIEWEPHTDDTLRRFRLYETAETENPDLELFPLPAGVTGVVDQKGRLIQLDNSRDSEELSEEIQDRLRNLIVPFPDPPLQIGDSWSIEDAHYALMGLELPGVEDEATVIHTYTLLAIENREGKTLARVRHEASFDLDGVFTIEEFGQTETFEVRVERQSVADVWVDLATGLIVERKEEAHENVYMAYLPVAFELPPDFPPEFLDLLPPLDQPMVLVDQKTSSQFTVRQVTP